MILMRDDRPDAFGGWLTTSLPHPALGEFSRIIIGWKEAYSIGWGGSSRITYPYLPMGEFRMRLKPLTVEGKPAGAESSTRIAVVPPFYETKLFWMMISAVAAALLALGVRQQVSWHVMFTLGMQSGSLRPLILLSPNLS